MWLVDANMHVIVRQTATVSTEKQLIMRLQEMALNHGRLMDQLRRAANNAKTPEGRNEFICVLLHAIDRPKTTIKKLRNGDPTTNVARRPNALADRQGFYIERVEDASDVHDVLDARIGAPPLR